MKTPTTEEKLKEVESQRDELARCALFAVSHFKIPGGGCVLRMNAAGTEYESESWVAWFRRALAAVGVVFDDDILDYQRASKTERKKLLKENPSLEAKLKANREKSA